MKETTLTIPSDQPRTRREPTKGWAWPKLRELWDYRELLFFFVWRDIKVRYKQTILGALWAIIQPFFTMVVFSLFFGRLA
jgi:lipopolysaccharide transport system permease protein